MLPTRNNQVLIFSVSLIDINEANEILIHVSTYLKILLQAARTSSALSLQSLQCVE